MKSSQRDGSHLAVMFLDLDKFKFINDTLGHQAGDELLKQTAERLCSVLRESDTVSRFGGDEFTVVLTDLEQGIDAEFIAEKMLAVLARPYLIED
jgi:diguanylate cyclase (GGDEF)-like protein